MIVDQSPRGPAPPGDRSAERVPGDAVPLPAAVLLAVLGGLALYLAFPAPGVWLLAPVGVACLVLAAAGRRPLAAAGVGLVHGLAFFGPLLWWAGIYVGWVAWIPLAVLQALYVALFAGLLPWTLRARLPAALRAVAVAALWVAVEALRARTPFGGFGWGRLAFSQADAPSLGLAALGGAPLVSFAVALCGALVAVALLPASPRRVAGVLPPLVAATVVLACGLLVPLPVHAENGSTDVAAVQGNVPRPGLDFNAERRAVLDNHVAVTEELAARVRAGEAPAPDIVLWPENSSDIDPTRNRDAYDVIDGAASAIEAPVLVGTVLRRDDDRLSNTTLVWEAGEGPVDRYDKQRPVPFAEYVPYRSFFRQISSAVDLVVRDFVPGTSTGLLTAADTPVGTMICFEVVEDGLVRDSTRAGAQLLAVQTNNATFGYTDESVQQLAMSRVRAVEHGRAVVHVSTVGVSALIAPDGAVLEDTELFTADVLQGSMPLRTSLTLAARVGAWPEAVAVALAAAAVLGGAVVGARSSGPRRRRRRDTPRTAPGRPSRTTREVVSP